MSSELVIKSAMQNVADFTLPCEMAWTIAQVKDKISTTYPTKPKREHQKLIYGGKLLPDHLSLKSILNQTQDKHVIHLVCSPSLTDIEQSKTKEQSASPVCSPSPLPPSPNTVYPQISEEVITTGINSGLTGTQWTPTYNTISDPTQQYLAMQQMYMQMMSQYFAQLNGNIPYGPILPNSPPVQQPSAVVPRPNVPQNVQVRQGEEEERDYIDYLYVFSRVAMLVALLLYYSSLERVIGVFVMMVLISMFARRNRHQQHEEVQRANERQNASTEQATVEDQISENEQVPDNSTNAESAPEVPQNASQTSTSVPSTIFTLITAFFSSLIPSDPLPVNVN